MITDKDPFNIVIAGVGGQGNILMNRILGTALVKKDYYITMIDDIGVSQRAGAVRTNMRISSKRQYGPMIPQGHAHLIISLEALESLRMLSEYGNPEILTLTSLRAISPAGVILGQDKYPDLKEVKKAIKALSHKAWFIDATDIALKLGAVIAANIVMLGAIVALKQLPLDIKDIQNVLKETLPAQSIDLNFKALDLGFNSIN